MKTELAAISNWLKTHKQDVTDEMVRSVVVDKDVGINLVLAFPDYDILSRFAMQVIPEAEVTKIETSNPASIYYTAKLEWKKRYLHFKLVVINNLPQRAVQVFSDDQSR